MNQHKFAFPLAWVVALLVATPVTAQLLNQPVLSLPQGPENGNTIVDASFGHGLNGGKLNSGAFGIGRISETFSLMALGNYVHDDTDWLDDEVSVGISAAVHLAGNSDSPFLVSAQGGVGWVSKDIGWNYPRNVLSIPLGIAISGQGSSVRPWIMPRVHLNRKGRIADDQPVGRIQTATIAAKNGTNVGVSAGVVFNATSGVGLSMAGDWLSGAQGPFLVSVGLQWVGG